jgi:predicted phosphohydrolase
MSNFDNLRVIGELSQLVLDCKQVPSFVRDELVQVNQAVEENTYVLQAFLEVANIEMALFRMWLHHVIQLAQKVDEQDRLMIQILEAMRLLLVEIVHLCRCDHLIIVKVDHFEPVLQSLWLSFVFFTQHEVNEVIVAHFKGRGGLKFARNFLENTVYSFSAECVALIPREILLVNDKVMISVQLPKTAIQNVEMLIRKELTNLVYIVLVRNLMQDIE